MRYPPYLAHYDMPLPPPPPARPDPEKLRQNLIKAIMDKDTSQARRMIEAGFEYDMRLYPTPAMLFIAARNDDRDTCRLLCAYGAAWSPEEASVFLPLLEDGSSAKNFLRRFTPKKPVDADIADILLPMIKDAELLASPGNAPVIEEWKKAYATHCEDALRLAKDHLKFARLENIVKRNPDFLVDTAALIKSLDSRFYSATSAIDVIGRFQQKNIPLSKVDLCDLIEPCNKVAMYVLGRWLQPLHQAGLLDEDQSGFRLKVLDMYAFYFHESKTHIDEKQREYYKNRIKQQSGLIATLCSSTYPVSKEEAAAFTNLYKIHDKDFLKKISSFEYFSAPAFSAVDLRALGGQSRDETLTRCFNYHASVRHKFEKPDNDWNQTNILISQLALAVLDNIRIVETEPPGHYPHARIKPRPAAEQEALPQKKRGTDCTGPR